MNALSKDIEGPSQSPIDINAIISMLKRRWLIIAAPIVLLTPLAVLVAFVLPPRYVAVAKVQVESQQIPSDLAQSTVTVGVGERIALISQRLMTRENLLDIARRYNVGQHLGDLSPTEIVGLMTQATNIRGVRLTGSRGPVTGVDISFEANSANVAADVANEFLSLLLEQNLRTRNQRASETTGYFLEEVERLSRELTQMEAELARFKVENQDALPDSLAFRRQMLADLESDVFERNLSLLQLEEEQRDLRTALEQGELVAVGEGTPEQREIARLRTILVQQSAIYAENHPNMRSLRSRIATLEAAIAAAAPEAAGVDGGALSRLERIETQLNLLQERQLSDNARIASLKTSISATPEVELELNDRLRRYRTTQTQHQQAVLKLAQAETGERLEVNQQAERFQVIERARAPDRPTSPNRPVIAAAGLIASAGLGLGIAILLELLNPSIRTREDLVGRLDVMPIGRIPYIVTPRERFVRKWRLRIILLVVLVATPATLFLIDRLFLPLPLIAERLIDRLGLDTMMALIQVRFGG